MRKLTVTILALTVISSFCFGQETGKSKRVTKRVLWADSPVVIGPDVRVEAQAMIVGPTVVGSGCAIAQHAVVSRSVLWNRCTVGHGVIVDHSLLADGARAANADFIRDTVLCSRR